MWAALEKLKAEGRILHWGVSVETVEEATLAIAIPRLPNYDVLLPEQIDLRIDNSLVMSNWTLLLPEALIIVPTPGSATSLTETRASGLISFRS